MNLQVSCIMYMYMYQVSCIKYIHVHYLGEREDGKAGKFFHGSIKSSLIFPISPDMNILILFGLVISSRSWFIACITMSDEVFKLCCNDVKNLLCVTMLFRLMLLSSINKITL